MKKAVGILLVGLMAVAALAAPGSGSIWGTVNRTQWLTEQISTNTALLAVASPYEAPGIASVLTMQMTQAQGLINQLAAINTTQLSLEDLGVYVTTVSNLNLALFACDQTAAAKGFPSLASSADANSRNLEHAVEAQMAADPRITKTRAPGSGTIWGTVN
jgi:hypothetical protein